MKKIISILLLTAALFCLAACDRGQSASDPAPSPTPSPTNDDLAILAASDTDAAAAVQSHVPPASSTDLEVDGAAYEKALSCVGMTIFDLYDTIGQPQQAPTYVASSQQENAQDGTLPYQGFSVKTLRTETEETVRDVVLNSDAASQTASQPAEQPADQSAEQPADQPVDQPAAG